TEEMITLGDLCDLVSGRVTLLVELKSRFDGDQRLVRRVASTLSRYAGPAAAMSFDPAQVVGLRALAPALPRGLVAQRRSSYREEKGRSALRGATTYLMDVMGAWPQFLAYSVNDLPAALPAIARRVFRLPLLVWVVRNAQEQQTAVRYADQIIFEGFRP